METFAHGEAHVIKFHDLARLLVCSPSSSRTTISHWSPTSSLSERSNFSLIICLADAQTTPSLLLQCIGKKLCNPLNDGTTKAPRTPSQSSKYRRAYRLRAYQVWRTCQRGLLSNRLFSILDESTDFFSPHSPTSQWQIPSRARCAEQSHLICSPCITCRNANAHVVFHMR